MGSLQKWKAAKRIPIYSNRHDQQLEITVQGGLLTLIDQGTVYRSFVGILRIFKGEGSRR